MLHFDDLVTDYGIHFGQRHHLPEHRQLELYSKKKKLSFASEAAGEDRRLRGCFATETAFSLLESLLLSQQPALESLPSWKKYLALPKKDSVGKLVAEVYRILRIHHLAWIQADGHLELDDGLVKVGCVYERCSLSLLISPVGLELLESFVFYYLDSFRQPYGAAYIEAILSQYFSDIVGEIKGFSDEDRVLYQFRQTMAINRHFRFDSDHPRYTVEDDHLLIEVGKHHGDAGHYPIDFYLVFDDVLHIIPIEALSNGKLSLDQLSRWRAKTEDGLSLPARFSYRFGRQKNVVGLPMT